MKLATKEKASTFIARPIRVLVPLIQAELAAGNRAGIEHYRRAGQMLSESREQVASFRWGTWLSKNFELSRSTANRYMQLAARLQTETYDAPARRTMRDVIEPDYKAARAVWSSVKDATREVNVETFAEAKQARADEIQLHRDLALELIDIGFKALATRLHPDRGGSRDAMRRLNRVRDELKDVAATRRFD
jgi:hypothetical protein